MVNKVMIDSGYYISVGIQINDNIKKCQFTFGGGYQEDGLKTMSIVDDGRFLRYYQNDIQQTIRDNDSKLSHSFEEVVARYINLLLQKFPKESIVQEVNGKYVNYFDGE